MALDLTSGEKSLPEHNLRILTDLLDAEDQGDMEEYRRLFSELYAPAHTLMAIKRVLGADYIRERNLRTHLADEKYGPGWMDLTEEQELARRAAERHCR